MSKLPGRIPFEDIEKFRNWAVPKVSGHVHASAEREAKKALLAGLPKQDHETIEDISDQAVSLGPMTAEQLAQITDEASREGFNQGYDEGLEKGLAAGERQGYEQGKAQALSEWNSQLKAQVDQLASTCEALLNPLAEQQRAITSELLNLAVMLAEQLVHQELSENPAVYWHWVQDALAQMPVGRKGATLYLPESVIAMVAEHKPPQWQNLSLAADTSLSLGAYRIESGPSEVVFDAANRLKQWREQIQPKPELSPALNDYQPLTPVSEGRDSLDSAMPDQASEVGSLEAPPLDALLSPESESE